MSAAARGTWNLARNCPRSSETASDLLAMRAVINTYPAALIRAGKLPEKGPID
jgi:hypothetical protein